MRWAAELTVQAVNEPLNVFICRLHINIMYRPAMWRFWCSAFLNVSAVPPLHSGFFCVTSPGLNYVFMGQVDEEGRGKIAPHHFVMAFKTKNQKGLSVLKNKRCWVTLAPRISAGRCSWGRPSCRWKQSNKQNVISISAAQVQAKNTRPIWMQTYACTNLHTLS